MANKSLLLTISVTSVAHGLVDAACAAVLFTLLTLNKAAPENYYLYILIYDVFAFSTQPFIGLWVDAAKAPARMAAFGAVLVALSMPLMAAPLVAAVLAGVGNAFFHAGGGKLSLDLAPGKAGLPGVFVAPGALGLTIGILIGKGGHFTPWPFIVLLFTAAVSLLALPQPRIAPHSQQPANLRWLEAVIALLFLSIVIRSLVGQILILPWKADTALLLALTLAAVLGKAGGGFLADRFGWGLVGVSGLVISAPLLAFFTPTPPLIIAGTFLFNVSMPVTLAGIAGMLPGKSGFAFGLTALAIVAGALPAFLPLQSITGTPLFIFITILFSIAALFCGLRLYQRAFGRLTPPAGNNPLN